MTDPSKTCSRCGDELPEPIQQYANYVVHDDFSEEEPVEVHYALKHTEQTKKKAQKVADETGRGFHAVAAEIARPNAEDKRVVTVGTERREHEDGSFTETAKKKEIDFSIPEEKFDREEVGTPDKIKDENVAFVKTEVEERPVQKTGLVCRSCWKKDDDEIIWGPDK